MTKHAMHHAYEVTAAADPPGPRTAVTVTALVLLWLVTLAEMFLLLVVVMVAAVDEREGPNGMLALQLWTFGPPTVGALGTTGLFVRGGVVRGRAVLGWLAGLAVLAVAVLELGVA